MMKQVALSRVFLGVLRGSVARRAAMSGGAGLLGLSSLLACGSSHGALTSGAGGGGFTTSTSGGQTACASLETCCAESQSLSAAQRATCTDAVNAHDEANCGGVLSAFRASGLCGGGSGSSGVGSGPSGATGSGAGGGFSSSVSGTGVGSSGFGGGSSTGSGGNTHPECDSYASKYCNCLGQAMAPDCVPNITDNCNTYYDLETALLQCFLAAPDCMTAFQCKP